jgi:hypothetical protein
MRHELARTMAILGVALAAGIVSPHAFAQLGDCVGVAAPGYKVLLDQIVGAQTGSSPADVQLFRERVRSAVAAKIRKLELDTDSRIELVRCDQRSPTSSSVFTHDRVDALDTRDVLLEIWGATGGDVDEAGREIRSVRLDFALIPVCELMNPRCVPFFPFLMQPTTKASPSAGVLELFQRADDVGTYSLMSLGVKLARAGDDQRALRYLCQADAFLARGVATDDKRALRGFVQRTVREIVARGRGTPTSTSSLLIEQQATAPCEVMP